PKQGVTQLMEQANRDAKWDGACGPGAIYGPNLKPGSRACWAPDDATSGEWIPQAITGVSDAQEDENWGDSPADPVVVATYDKTNPGRTDYAADRGTCENPSVSDACNEKGVRITFINQSTGKYRHVLLVWPYLNANNNISFDALHAREGKCPADGPVTKSCRAQNGIHAGGMTWYGNYLYVADTANGMRVFDMRKIMDLNPDQNADVHDPTPDGLKSNVKEKRKVGRQSNVWFGFGYRYVMPQVATLKFTTARNAGATDKNQCYATGRPKASYVSLDRTGTDSLALGEYCNYKNGSTSPGRVGTFPMASLAAAVEAPNTTVNATEAFGLPDGGNLGNERMWHKIQGVLRHEGKWYFHRSNMYSNGRLLQATEQSGQLVANPKALESSVGPEDLYMEHGRGNNQPPELWSLSEHAPSAGCASCQREVYSYPMSSVISGFGS
ncbi:hypothetical protein ACWF94_40590, partial [Streptomyces sp. NPDC055078]